MIENLNVFDFSLSVEDKQILSGLDTNKSSFLDKLLEEIYPQLRLKCIILTNEKTIL